MGVNDSSDHSLRHEVYSPTAASTGVCAMEGRGCRPRKVGGIWRNDDLVSSIWTSISATSWMTGCDRTVSCGCEGGESAGARSLGEEAPQASQAYKACRI